MKKLEWYAFMQGFNDDKLVYTNVIRQDLIEEVKKAIKKNLNYDEIKEIVKTNLMYHYWSKSEYEVIVSSWAKKDFEEKIDVYYQLEPNIDRITQYLIRNIAPIKSKKIIGG